MLAPIFRTFGIAAGHVVVSLVMVFGMCGNAYAADDSSEINRMFSAGQVNEAFARLDTLIAAKPRDPSLRFQKGVLLTEASRSDEAIAVFAQLTIDFPEIPEPYNNLAVIYAAQGEYDKARTALEAALRAKPDYAVAQQNLGDVYAQLARAAYARALQLDPANTALPTKLNQLRGLVTSIPANPAKTPSASK